MFSHCDFGMLWHIKLVHLDEENNIYLLDEGNDNCPIRIFKFNAAGQFINKYKIYNRSNNNNINLTNFVIDKINNYYYIPFTDISDDKKYKVGIFKRKIDDEKDNEWKCMQACGNLFQNVTNISDLREDEIKLLVDMITNSDISEEEKTDLLINISLSLKNNTK